MVTPIVCASVRVSILSPTAAPRLSYDTESCTIKVSVLSVPEKPKPKKNTYTAIRQSGEYKGKTVAYGIASTAQKFNKGINGMGSVGLIIGATIGQWIDDSGVDPAKFTGPILSPGYGWQGAEAKDLRTVFKGTKGNVLVTVSRFIAAHGPDIASLSQATEAIALDVRQALMEATQEGTDETEDDAE